MYMKKWIMICACVAVFQTALAQHITRQYNNVSFSAALKDLNARQHKYTINFVYDELEDFRVTKSIRNQSVPDAIMQLIGFYPIKMTQVEDNIIVECTQKTPTKMIGRIIDNKKRPVDFANVALLNVSDSSLINGGVTNENGQFVIPCEATKAIVRVSCVGYHTAVDTYNTGKIGTITLKEATMNLQKVVVKAERGHVVKKKGNVKTFFFSHHANETKDIYTALTEVPDLRIDPTMKTISLAKGGAPLVLIDGIPKSHSLASISSAMIDKVEVSNSVPLEYMGQGYSGVVNIITKKHKEASRYFNMGVLSHPVVAFGSADANFSYDKSRFSIYSGLTGFAFWIISRRQLMH